MEMELEERHKVSRATGSLDDDLLGMHQFFHLLLSCRPLYIFVPFMHCLFCIDLI